MALCTGRGNPQLMFPVPQSLQFLFLSNCGVVDNSDVPVLFSGQQLFHMDLGDNLFQFLPNNIDLKTLRVLDLRVCRYLKSLPCLPSTLEEFYVYWCSSLKKITFESARFKLREFGCEGCLNLSEIQGLLKLVSVAELDEAYLGQMKWIKAYEDRKVDLIGDEITKYREFNVQISVLKLDLPDVDTMRNISRAYGVASIAMDTKDNTLTVIGDLDPVRAVLRLRKICRTEIVSFGPIKEPKKKKEEGGGSSVILALDVRSEKQKQKVMKIVSRPPGVASTLKKKNGYYTVAVTGDVDPVTVVSKLRKICHADLVSVGPIKEPEKKKEDEKKKADEA